MTSPNASGTKARVALALFFIFAFFGGVGIAFALPPEPIDPDPVGDSESYTPPDNGFAWRMPSRFGVYENGIIDFHWDEANAAYEPDHVNPATYAVILDGCRTEAEELTGASAMTFSWVIDGETVAGNACRIQHNFDAQGTYTANLTITQLDGSVLLDSQGRGNPFTQSVVVRDFLIVSLGDSYASGEGSPDVPQLLGGYDLTGQPTNIAAPVRWQDRRCHRSANSSPAQAARMLESADPHSSVTFLSFACSGATISQVTYKDASAFDPYRAPAAFGWTQFQGSGILGTYSGTEPPNPDRPQDDQLPSQIDQLMAALTNNGQVPPRLIDALLISGGGNDIGFGNIASLCILYDNCMNYPVTSANFSGMVPLATRIQQALGTLPARYSALATAISANIPFSPDGRVYITQYPDASSNDQGGYCGAMAEDVIPQWMQIPLALVSIVEGGPYPPLGPYWIAGSEVAWAGGTVGLELNNAVGAGAQAHGWVLVDGINDSTANLFSGHGYCATDNWIRRASEAVELQGPWDAWFVPVVPPHSTATKGTLHPTARGYQVVAERIFDEMATFLLPASSQNPPAPPTFTSTTTNALVGANGWLTGHVADVACPAGATDCGLLQVVATTPATTAIRGASLLVNGVPASCSATGVTTGSVTCQTQLVNAQTFRWSMSFAADGIFRLDFTASARNDAMASFSREVKVDLNNPTATHALSAPVPASGWHQSPVSVSISALDGAGSGIREIQVGLAGSNTVFNGNRADVDLDADGAYAISYVALDQAGRASTSQALSVNIDQTAPSSIAESSPLPTPNGWTNASAVIVTLSATDDGGSGVDAFNYSATGAQPIAATTVDGTAPVQLTITAEGETIINFFAQDVAGNVESAQMLAVRIDRTAPITTCGSADGLWHADNVSIPCSSSDSGSGLAVASEAAFALETAVATGFEIENALTSSRQICDAAGNCATAGPVSGNRIDRKAPDISMSVPGGNYLLNETVLAAYSCADGGSGVAACDGPVASGSPVNTTSSGSKSFLVQAVDNAGNVSTQSASYNVSYAMCILFDQGRSYKRGSNVPVKLQICDADGTNVSVPEVVLQTLGLTKVDNTASSSVVNTGNSNPDYEFRFDETLGGYIYNLSSGNLSAGTWSLSFAVSGDPLSHTVLFDVR